MLLHNSTFTASDVPFAFFALCSLNAALSAARNPGRLSWTTLAALTAGIPPLIRINGLGLLATTGFFLFCTWKDMMHVPPSSLYCPISSDSRRALCHVGILQGILSQLSQRGHLLQCHNNRENICISDRGHPNIHLGICSGNELHPHGSGPENRLPGMDYSCLGYCRNVGRHSDVENGFFCP